MSKSGKRKATGREMGQEIDGRKMAGRKMGRNGRQENGGRKAVSAFRFYFRPWQVPLRFV
jgi:hypothetical protein